MSTTVQEQILEEESLLGLDVPLEVAVIGEDDTFRTQNASASDWERRQVMKRTAGGITSRIELVDVRHGTMDLEGHGVEGTVMVFRFRFDSEGGSRRVIRAWVNIEFFARDEAGAAPVVEAIAPEQRWTVKPTTDHESSTRSLEMNVGAPSESPVDVGVTAKLEKTVQRDVSDATTITGSINLGSGMNYGEATVAAWNLQENKRRKSGVPDSVQVAILLRREDSEPFHANVTLEVDVDWRSKLQSLIGKVPLDDPVLFNPQALPGQEHPPAGRKKGRSCGVRGLDRVDLLQLCTVRMACEAPFVNKPDEDL